MRVVIAGGHGKIAKLLERELAGRGDTAVGLIRNPDHAAALRAAGAQPVVCDLEHTDVDTVAAHLAGADAVVFAAGAGPGSGAARKDTVDRAAAVLLADAAQAAGVRRYLLVSSMGVDAPPSPGRDEVWAAYLAAKKAAEQDVTGRDLDVTVLRPGRLTDDEPVGRITLDRHAPAGPVTRADVARVLLALLYAPGSAGLTLELVGGETPIADAVAAVAR
ncbi:MULTISPECIES: NAD(P)H-binding protein [Micromonospora]|uniref:NAD-dependent epimerase/dehydratase family protein n=1 Tax=Micromonospora solifontis TaxID=2487138 RepID=A0ABX9WN13_9ACTN|nr:MULTISPECIES: NAD(P)H-binding protein [Micromonospora]NES13698.1 NAD(P)H-binding protein [Micromonospora sp. PPF5-17B]NES35507.1 NAD(P)H-binding protein [Micromonospora solifontis]NES55336.1 NAD(P)H-binding protein [Micromonospora sp. PPF5-6]RNM00754.1 NAD-dependent epimerase/dehydratase family protein [Micromonospora solifontis]